jgi:hypothetical protein
MMKMSLEEKTEEITINQAFKKAKAFDGTS